MNSVSLENCDVQVCELVLHKVAKLFSDELNLEVPSTELDLFEAGLLDSLKFVELLVKLEQVFAVHVSMEDLEVDNFRSIRKIAGFVTGQNGNRKLP